MWHKNMKDEGKKMITPEQLAETMQNVRCRANYVPNSNETWHCLNSYDRGVLVSIARTILHDIEHAKKCEEYPDMRQLALDLKCVLDKYC